MRFDRSSVGHGEISKNVKNEVSVLGGPDPGNDRQANIDDLLHAAVNGHGQFVAREPNAPVNKALSTWKELTAPRKVERTGIPASGV